MYPGWYPGNSIHHKKQTRAPEGLSLQIKCVLSRDTALGEQKRTTRGRTRCWPTEAEMWEVLARVKTAVVLHCAACLLLPWHLPNPLRQGLRKEGLQYKSQQGSTSHKQD